MKLPQIYTASNFLQGGVDVECLKVQLFMLTDVSKQFLREPLKYVSYNIMVRTMCRLHVAYQTMLGEAIELFKTGMCLVS